MYIVQTIEEFFRKLDKMQRDLETFSQTLDKRSEKVPKLLENFEKNVFANFGNTKKTATNAVDQAVTDSLEKLRKVIESWKEQIEADRKGKEFIKKNEKYLVVMVFGAVKAGKSSLGNFFAGKKFVNAPFDNHYKKIPKPIFETETRGRDTGDIEKDASGNTWFSEGVIDTTGAIQYFTLSGLRWIDSPGTGAVGKEGDTKDMTKLVEEYLSYTDMCIFLMNSAEPGLQDDMRYMQNLNKEGQEALVVITKSDKKEEDWDDEINDMTQVLKPKPPETRKLQEDDICRRLKEEYPDIDERKFRAISTSTMLASEAIKEQDDEKFKDSNLDKLMKILGDKVSDNAIARKQENPRRLLNSFVDSVVTNLKSFDDDITAINNAVEDFKNTMSKKSSMIVSHVVREVQREVRDKANEWNRAAKHHNKIDNSVIITTISDIMQRNLDSEINEQMSKIIEDFQSKEMSTVQANISVPDLEMKTATITHTYTEEKLRERDPEGFVENVRGFFGKKYYETRTRTRTKEETIEIGTNFDEFIDSLIPQVESTAKKEADKALEDIRDNYFNEKKRFADNIKKEVDFLRSELLKLKF
ncbi:MAG: 50S ribosome-binding GTPase [Selenomonadaceae bacterium]|nr:50S ribosome-binding GTPase [Selenomonadaceae bacterium]